jgi:hypothetical protein
MKSLAELAVRKIPSEQIAEEFKNQPWGIQLKLLEEMGNRNVHEIINFLAKQKMSDITDESMVTLIKNLVRQLPEKYLTTWLEGKIRPQEFFSIINNFDVALKELLEKTFSTKILEFYHELLEKQKMVQIKIFYTGWFWSETFTIPIDVGHTQRIFPLYMHLDYLLTLFSFLKLQHILIEKLKSPIFTIVALVKGEILIPRVFSESELQHFVIAAQALQEFAQLKLPKTNILAHIKYLHKILNIIAAKKNIQFGFLITRSETRIERLDKP